MEMTEKYGLDPSSCWVVGDKWIDPQTGLDAGMRGALVRTGKPVDQALVQKAAQKSVYLHGPWRICGQGINWMTENKLPSPWDLQKDELHADCRIFEVRKRRFKRRSDGVEGDFFVLDTNDWVNVLAITPGEQVVLVRRFDTEARNSLLSPLGSG